MKKYINKTILYNFIINFILIFLLEVIFKIINDFSLNDWATIRIMFSSIIYSLIISCLDSFFNKKVHKYINLTFLLIASIYAWAQTGFNNYIGVYMSLGTSSQLGAVIDYIREYILSFKSYYYFIFLPFIIGLIYYIFINRKIVNKFSNENIIDKGIKLRRGLLNVFVLIFFVGIYISTLFLPFMQNKLQLISNKDLLINPSNPSLSIRQFGIITFGISDIRNYFIEIEEVIDIPVLENSNSNDNQNTSRVFDDTKWNELIQNEKNNTLKTLNNYFINNSITDVNEYTGLFEDKNLIVIMLESVNDIIINEQDYPNFYKMYNEGWSWKNNYSPRNSCSTGNNEMSGMIGLYSIYNSCTANIYDNNTYFNSIFNLFNNKNYHTFSAHNYTDYYYSRKTIHKNMGSNIYYGVKDLGIKYSSEYKDWSSDEDFMTQVLNILDNTEGENFMAWLTTVSSHQPYYYSSVEGDKYLDLYKDLDIRTDLKRYKSKLKILDNALGILLSGLEEKGILEDTVIVMYGDHYPYGLSTNTINTVLDYDTSVDHEAERVPFVIYNSEIEPKVFDEYTSYINIVPTVANLFNLDYDPRLYVGTDLLSSDYQSLVVFADGSWQNEKAYYNAAKGSIKYFGSEEYSIEELQAINNSVDLKIKMSSLAIKNNYFNYLGNNINIKDNTDDNIENDIE